MSKYVFCDLDYTLLDDNKNISEINYKAIKDFESKGNHFIICTGRVPFAMKQYKDILQSSDVINGNGSIITIDNKIVKLINMDDDYAKCVINYGIEHNLHLRIFTLETLYILNKPDDDPAKAVLYPNHAIITKDNAFDTIKDNKILKIIISDSDHNVLEKAKEYISKQIDAELTYSSNYFLEVNTKNQNKGLGILDYCKLKNIDIKDTISIGDNDNDITMFKTTALSACPSNAIDDVKKIVTYVSKCDYMHDAIADILNNFDIYEK